MIAQHYKDMLGAKSVIREISEWSTARGKEIGYDNVFDYSLGNPSVPLSAAVHRSLPGPAGTHRPGGAARVHPPR